ncbi:MAG: efflux RND transporter permease subunit [Sulfurimonas sp.]|uniref:efflux RND transporter permease subunit n=1 Tax=Sulfurimonas sp. TaxID=2022749 RepID=UPI003D125859
MKHNFIETSVYNLLQSRAKKIFTIFFMLLALASSVMLVTSEAVKVKLLPNQYADNFTMYIDLPQGKSVYETKEVTSCIVETLKNEDIITNMSIFLGESAPVDFSGMLKGRLFANGENIANILVNLKKEHEREESSVDAVHRLRPIIQKNCSMHNSNIKFVQAPAGPPYLAAIVLEITSDEKLLSMEKLGFKLETIFKSIDGLVDIDVLTDSNTPRHVVELNREKILKSNLKLDQVKNILYLSFEGMDIAYTNSADVQNQIPIHLVLDKKTKLFNHDSKKELLNKFSEIKLMNSLGMLVPLSELVTIATKAKGHQLSSKNLSPLINVVAETDMISQIYALLDIREAIQERLSDEYEVQKTGMLDFTLIDKRTKESFTLHWDGEQKVSMDTITDLSMALGVAIVLIFFMMVLYYKNFSLATAIVLASFISVVGVIYAHLIFDIFTTATFYMTGTSLIGFIALIGINSRNSLLIIDFAKQLIEEKYIDADRAIAISVATRAKPILLTVLAIIFASALLATDPVFGGLGVALIGGTLAAYAVSLFIVPIIIQIPLIKQYPIKKEAHEEK